MEGLQTVRSGDFCRLMVTMDESQKVSSDVNQSKAYAQQIGENMFLDYFFGQEKPCCEKTQVSAQCIFFSAAKNYEW